MTLDILQGLAEEEKSTEESSYQSYNKRVNVHPYPERAYVKYNGRFYPLFDCIVKYIIKKSGKKTFLNGYRLTVIAKKNNTKQDYLA